MLKKLITALIFIIVALSFVQLAIGQKPDNTIATERAKALAFVADSRYLDAFPILEKIAPSLPNDVEVWTSYGIAIATRSGTLNDPVERKSERKRAYEA